MRTKFVLVAVAIAALPLAPVAQHGDLTQNQPATADAAVDFGVLPSTTDPLGPPPCATGIAPSPAIGGPADPCAYKLHHLTPEEVTILKGGEVTFQIHGGGHAFAIYAVSKDTTRDELGQFLCPGDDPSTIRDPNAHTCPANNQNLQHVISDGHGDVVIVASPNVTNAHPDNRVWYTPGRLMSAGGVQFLVGGTTSPGTNATGGQLITYQFLKTGRYLVLCMNRAHFLNDWMFGFVNVTGE